MISPPGMPVDFPQLLPEIFCLIIPAVNYQDYQSRLIDFDHNRLKCPLEIPVHPRQSPFYSETWEYKLKRTQWNTLTSTWLLVFVSLSLCREYIRFFCRERERENESRNPWSLFWVQDQVHVTADGMLAPSGLMGSSKGDALSQDEPCGSAGTIGERARERGREGSIGERETGFKDQSAEPPRENMEGTDRVHCGTQSFLLWPTFSLGMQPAHAHTHARMHAQINS